MWRSFECFAVIALLLVFEISCITVQDVDSQNVSSTVQPTASIRMIENVNSSELNLESLKVENRNLDSDESKEFMPTTASTIQKIPPTLLNTRIVTPGMSLKDLA